VVKNCRWFNLDRKPIFALALMVVGGMFLALCTSEDAVSAPEEKVTLKLGVLPVDATMPYAVAEHEGLYADEGIDVELVFFSSALERSSALVAGEVDGILSDPIGAALLKAGGTDIVVVSVSMGGIFNIIAGPDSGIGSVRDLKGKKIAISSGTIIEYVTDEMLEAEGIPGGEVDMVEIKSMPLRVELLLQNELDAATLPEPLSSLTLAKGGKLIVSGKDRLGGTKGPKSFLIFRKKFARENPDTVKRFLRVNEKAVEAVNSDPERYKELFLETSNVPDESEFEEIITWMISKGLLEEPMSYGELVDTGFLQ